MDPHSISKLDPDSHSLKKLDPDEHQVDADADPKHCFKAAKESPNLLKISSAIRNPQVNRDL
jgi:hypothetical protein